MLYGIIYRNTVSQRLVHGLTGSYKVIYSQTELHGVIESHRWSYIFIHNHNKLELSWGSVQAETVRLQFQFWSDGHLFDIEFLFSLKFGFSFKGNLLVEFLKNIGWKKNWVKKILLIWGNVASTNVALTNVIVIVDIC